MTRDQRNIGFSRFHEILNDRLKKEDDSCDQEILIAVRVIFFYLEEFYLFAVAILSQFVVEGEYEKYLRKLIG